MSFKQTVAIFGVASTLATVGLTALGPHEPKSTRELQQQQHDFAENDKKMKEELRQEGQELDDAVTQDELRPREVRPVKRLPFRAP